MNVNEKAKQGMHVPRIPYVAVRQASSLFPFHFDQPGLFSHSPNPLKSTDMINGIEKGDKNTTRIYDYFF
jgi:hypothetical protein